MAEGGSMKTQSQNEKQDLYTLGIDNANFGDVAISEQNSNKDNISEVDDEENWMEKKNEKKNIQGLISVEFHILLAVSLYGFISEAATGGNWSTYLLKESIDEHIRDSRYNLASVGNDYSTTQGVGPVGQGKPQTLGHNENLIKQQGIKIKDIHQDAKQSLRRFQSPALVRLRFAMARFSLNYDLRIPIIDFSLPPMNIIQECGGSESFPNINDALQNFRLSPFCLPAHMMRLTTIISFGQTKYYPMTPLVSALKYERQVANLNKEPLQMILQFVKQFGTWMPRQQLAIFSEDYMNIRIKPTIFNTYYTHIPSAQNKRWIKYALQLPLSYLSNDNPNDIKQHLDYHKTALHEIGNEEQSEDDQRNAKQRNIKARETFQGIVREKPIFKYGLPFPAQLSRVKKNIVSSQIHFEKALQFTTQESRQIQQIRANQTSSRPIQSENSLHQPFQQTNLQHQHINTHSNAKFFLPQWSNVSASLSGHLFRHQQNLVSSLICAFFAFTEAMCFQSSDRTGNPGDQMQPTEVSQVNAGIITDVQQGFNKNNVQGKNGGVGNKDITDNTTEVIITQGQILDELNKTLIKDGRIGTANRENMHIKQKFLHQNFALKQQMFLIHLLKDEFTQQEQGDGISIKEDMDFNSANGQYVMNRGPPNKNLQMFIIETNPQLMNTIPYYKITNGSSISQISQTAGSSIRKVISGSTIRKRQSTLDQRNQGRERSRIDPNSPIIQSETTIKGGSQSFALAIQRNPGTLYEFEQVDSERRSFGSSVFPDKLSDDGNPVWLVDLL
ncbi:MAG: hypothetical protein EZS28_021263, partial [Streblomastix strix]